MKKRTSLLLAALALICLSILPSSKASASHAAGGEIIYEWIQDSTYRFYFKFYRDCGGINEPASQVLCYWSTCNTSQQYSATMQKWPGQIPPGVANGAAVTLGCSGSSTECSTPANNSIPGVREWWYYTTITLPYRCNYWSFSTAIGSRNSSNNIPAVNFYVETTYNNLAGQGITMVNGVPTPFGNSSPYFNKKPIPYTCLDLPYSFNNDAIDPDGDSLVTEMIAPLNGANCGPGTPLTLTNKTPPLAIPNNPFQTAVALTAPTGSFVLNQATGQMNFTATEAGPQTMAVRVKEYRNGILLGSIIRDVQVQVLQPNICNYTPSQFTFNAPSVDSANIGAGNRVEGCLDQEMSFCFDITTTDPIGVLKLSDNSATSTALQGMTVTYTGQGTNSVQGCVTWRPTGNQTGLKALIINVSDSTCHPPGIVFQSAFTIDVFVYPPTVAYQDDSICPGEMVVLNAAGGDDFEWTEVNPGSSSTLSCTQCQNPQAKPFSTMKYAVASTATAFCRNNKDTVEIKMLPTPLFTPAGDISVCPGNTVNYNLAVQVPVNDTLEITWNPTTYLSNPNSDVTDAYPLDDITYYIEIKTSGNDCKAFDTSIVTVLDGFQILSPDTAICLGDSVQMRAVGDPGYAYTWSVDKGTPAMVSISDPAILTPIIKPAEFKEIVFELRATRDGCDDSIATWKLDVQPVPTVVVDEDQSICYGDTLRINSQITPAYDKYSLNWTPGSALDRPTAGNPIFTGFDDATMQLIVTTSAGCNGSDEIVIDVLPSDFLFLSNDTAICPGGTANIILTGNGVTSMWWDENSPYLSDRSSWTPDANPVVSQTYTVYGLDTNGCNDTQSVNVIVKPAAVVHLADSVTIFPGGSYTMNPTGNALHYSWFPPVGLSRADVSDPVATPEVFTRYFVTATTEAGCSTTDSISVFVSADSYMDIPNAFAPGRGPNGVFRVLHLGEAELKKFAVFNRWGVKMFETNDISQGWDGRYNGEAQPMGVYIYTVEAETFTGRKFTKQGNVTLLR